MLTWLVCGRSAIGAEGGDIHSEIVRLQPRAKGKDGIGRQRDFVKCYGKSKHQNRHHCRD